MLNVNEVDFDEVVNNIDGPFILDFWAPWCGPCRMVAPLLEQIEQEHDLNVIKINIDENPELARRFTIMSIPTIMYFKDGHSKAVIGAKPKKELEEEFGLVT